MRLTLPVRLAAVVAISACVTPTVFAQTPEPMKLTLAEAIDLATAKAETLDIARAGQSRASADQMRARSAKLPQVNFSASYTRTFASEFSAVFQNLAPTCAPLNIDPTSSLAAQVAELERAASCGAIGASTGIDLSKLPFGQANEYLGTVSFTQALYAGGSITAQQQEAELSARVAGLNLSASEAQLALDVTQAFYDAALSDRMVTIAQSTYDQAAAAYDQTQLAFQAGRQPEFELLRAQVARDNDRPAVIRNGADRDIAYLHLRQLLKLPADAPLALDVDLGAATLAPPPPFADALANVEAQAGTASDRNTVQQAAAEVDQRKSVITVAHAARLPVVNLGSSYGRVAYPAGALPSAADFRTDFSANVNVQIPIFTGYRLQANERSARADLAEAEAELKQARELAILDSATALQNLKAAQAVWDASAGTIEQAQRAYEIAALRNREGLSTQLELSDSRLSLQTAEANRAQAARDLQVARAHVALLPNLPVTAH